MLSIGMTLTLEPLDKEIREKYRTKVIDINGSHLYIDYPVNMETDKTVFLLNKTRLKVSFVDKYQQVFEFQTEVIGRKKGTVPMVALHYPGDVSLKKIQRRQYVRIQTAIDISLTFEDETFVTITEDISAGGLAVILPKEKSTLKKGLIGKCWLVLPMAVNQYEYIIVDCKIIRIFERDHMLIASLQFVDLDEASRQKIIRFCFDRQIDLKKKGLI
ncbi:MAG: flagellar brake domain-containing protein [Bacillus sp. (in: Bacteria)]|nr:flagellar brake domain-containing protein [Bacillus sp. (in: firmicutes)]